MFQFYLDIEENQKIIFVANKTGVGKFCDKSYFLLIPRFPLRLVSPVITTAPPPFLAVKRAYDTVTLQCAARGSPVPSLEWSKDGVILSTNTTTRSTEEVKGQLVIPRFGPHDRGVYKCFFKNYDNGTAEISTTAGIK